MNLISQIFLKSFGGDLSPMIYWKLNQTKTQIINL